MGVKVTKITTIKGVASLVPRLSPRLRFYFSSGRGQSLRTRLGVAEVTNFFNIEDDFHLCSIHCNKFYQGVNLSASYASCWVLPGEGRSFVIIPNANQQTPCKH